MSDFYSEQWEIFRHPVLFPPTPPTHTHAHIICLIAEDWYYVPANYQSNKNDIFIRRKKNTKKCIWKIWIFSGLTLISFNCTISFPLFWYLTKMIKCFMYHHLCDVILRFWQVRSWLKRTLQVNVIDVQNSQQLFRVETM